MKRVILPLLLLVALVLLAYQSLIAWDVRNTKHFYRAYSYFLTDAAALGCLRKETLIKAAKARGWGYEDNRQPPYRSWSPDEFLETLRVFVEPQLNFAKEPGVTLFFDDGGCLIS
ncbi:hypothetical protein [Leisingera sp. M658]|uniref:hypothetical protein n=1 Tax=Leisingera sp. M658 TaxID=2867015 RepID=UPI0021A5BEBD|nr:hypothetical protein [Leisingera sp. M658]UWQ76433.1 hypothetical protein K3724_08400 [Leisingera sp. M658]